MKRPATPTVPGSDPVARRLRDAWQDIMRWIDSGTRTTELQRLDSADADLLELVKPAGDRYAISKSGLLSGVSGAVSSVFGRTGAVTAQSGDYDATQVGLGSVTNDAQLKRSANDFSTFTQKTTPVGADILLIEDSAASGAKKYIAVSSLGGGGSSLRPSMPFLAPETTPDAWDLEAGAMTDPDLANNGWTIQLRDSPWTVLTRNGDVTQSALPPTGTYNSTLLHGTLVLQFNSTAQVHIYKATSGSYTYKFHAWNGEFVSGNSNYAVVATGANFGASGNTFFYAGNENTNMVSVRFVPPSSYSVEANYAVSEFKKNNVKYIDHDPGVLTRSYFIAQDGTFISLAPTTGFNIASIGYAGMWLCHTSGHFCMLDFIRRRPLHSFP